MTKTQVYLAEEDLKALHELAEARGKSVAELIRQAIHPVWVKPKGNGPVGIWAGEPRRTSVDHDSVYDEP